MRQLPIEDVPVRENEARSATTCGTIESIFLDHSVVVVPTGSGREAKITL